MESDSSVAALFRGATLVLQVINWTEISPAALTKRRYTTAAYPFIDASAKPNN
jgi:hypothetical protein